MLEAWDNTVAPASRGGVLFERWWNRYTDAIEAAYDGDPQPFAEGWTPEAPTSTPRGLADLAIAETVAHFGAWGRGVGRCAPRQARRGGRAGGRLRGRIGVLPRTQLPHRRRLGQTGHS